jgi:hypothetical protein
MHTDHVILLYIDPLQHIQYMGFKGGSCIGGPN